MSLSDQLNSLQPKRSNQGCVTCRWLDTLDEVDRRAFDGWLADGKSVAQLWQACFNDTDNPLKLSSTPFRDHVRHHEPLA